VTRILALDTASEFGSLALVSGAEVEAGMALHAPEGFGPILFGQVKALLDRAGCRLDEIACFAAAAGPGSFTGVRVGMAAVKGLAEACGKPALAVSNLEAIAWHGTAPLRAPVLDARRDQVYAALYNARLELAAPEVVTGFAAWLAALPADEAEFLSTDFSPFQAVLAKSRFAGSRVTTAPRALAPAVGRIAALRLERGQVADPATLDANYVRRSDAELFWKDGA
jgi:tRNA threonylcarbamoyladenosine biosynthesis protein TsaB